jgi:hypothetical protein
VGINEIDDLGPEILGQTVAHAGNDLQPRAPNASGNILAASGPEQWVFISMDY